MSKDGPHICAPCRDQTHMECDGTEKKPCDCLICFGERVGDREFGQRGEDKHR